MLRRRKFTTVFFAVISAAALLFPSGRLNAGEELQSGFINTINIARLCEGLQPLLENETLNTVAGMFAADMAQGSFLSHRSPTYGSVFAYLKGTGFRYSCAGISIVCGRSAAAAAEALIQKDSKILAGRYGRIGIGAAPSGESRIFVALYTGDPAGPTAGLPAPEPEPLPFQTRPPNAGSPGNGPLPADLAAKATVELDAGERAMLEMVNRQRVKAGLGVLCHDPALTRLARTKGQDMVKLHYFSHDSPTYGSPFDMMRTAGISFRTAGENLAGAPSPERAFNALMNSPAHRANILNSSFTGMGIGVIEGGSYGKVFVQLFTGR